MQLPKYVVLKSMNNNKYLSYVDRQVGHQKPQDGSLQFSEDSPANQRTKFEVESEVVGLVHLKCCYNNKYLVRSSPSEWWIRAAADRVEEDVSKWSCTLFEFVNVDKDGDSTTTMGRFRHVELGRYVGLFRSGPSPFSDSLFAGWKDLDNEDLSDVCMISDWDSLQNDKDDEVVDRDSDDDEEEDKSVELEHRDEMEFSVISSANALWGAFFTFTKILPKALPQVYRDVKVLKGDGFSEGSIREISIVRGATSLFETLTEKIVYVDHGTKTITLSLLAGGMLSYYETFKMTVSVTPKKRHGRGCRVNWSYRGNNPKQSFDKEELKKLFMETLECVDDYLECNAVGNDY
ncbi:MLP-like protein 423 [Linum grandiflorum]